MQVLGGGEEHFGQDFSSMNMQNWQICALCRGIVGTLRPGQKSFALLPTKLLTFKAKTRCAYDGKQEQSM